MSCNLEDVPVQLVWQTSRCVFDRILMQQYAHSAMNFIEHKLNDNILTVQSSIIRTVNFKVPILILNNFYYFSDTVLLRTPHFYVCGKLLRTLDICIMPK